MPRRVTWFVIIATLASTATLVSHAAKGQAERRRKNVDPDPVKNAIAMVEQGRQTFRFDTFGDQAFWGDTLKLHQAIEGAANGGVGPGVSPRTAVSHSESAIVRTTPTLGCRPNADVGDVARA
jgi:hypothetical protein